MTSKSFIIEELVPEHIFKKRGDKAWELLNPNLIKTIDAIKEYFPKGIITINNWKWKGDRNWSGLRTPESKYYSETSQHSLGNAVDMIFSEYSSDEVRQFIIDNTELFPFITGIEMGISWVHIDVRNSDELQLFYP